MREATRDDVEAFRASRFWPVAACLAEQQIRAALEAAAPTVHFERCVGSDDEEDRIAYKFWVKGGVTTSVLYENPAVCTPGEWEKFCTSVLQGGADNLNLQCDSSHMFIRTDGSIVEFGASVGGCGCYGDVSLAVARVKCLAAFEALKAVVSASQH